MNECGQVELVLMAQSVIDLHLMRKFSKEVIHMKYFWLFYCLGIYSNASHLS